MNLNYHKMKFLRLAFYVLIAQLVLSGCAGEAVEETSSSSASDSSSSEINFDAYVGRNASTRTSVTDIDFLKRDIKNPDNFNAGFGVFARYHHISLLDTEHVTWNKDQNHWEYTNTRYWPSERSVDFYAFAPYSDVPKLNNNFEIVFPANWSPVDLVYAKAEGKTKTDNPVTFTFKHALARLSFDITANQTLEKNGAVIKVNEVKLYGEKETIGIFRMEGRLNLKTGGWSPYDNGTRWFYTWTPDGKVEGEEDGKEDGEENNKKNSIIYKLSAPPQLDYEHDKITNADDSYIFIIPQEKPKNFNLKITYTVEQGKFKEDVTVKKNLLDVLPGDSNPYFKGGKAYVFHFKLSLDPVKFDVKTTVGNWIGNEVKDEITI